MRHPAALLLAMAGALCVGVPAEPPTLDEVLWWFPEDTEAAERLTDRGPAPYSRLTR